MNLTLPGMLIIIDQKMLDRPQKKDETGAALYITDTVTLV